MPILNTRAVRATRFESSATNNTRVIYKPRSLYDNENRYMLM